jgi:heme-degrading monooxygenase HmoA
MPFVVINSVRAEKDELPAIALDVQRTGLDSLREQPGFRTSRLLIAEDKSELLLISEWESRDAFVAFRQTEIGRQGVQQALQYHPHIAFYEVIASYDA